MPTEPVNPVDRQAWGTLRLPLASFKARANGEIPADQAQPDRRAPGRRRYAQPAVRPDLADHPDRAAGRDRASGREGLPSKVGTLVLVTDGAMFVGAVFVGAGPDAAARAWRGVVRC
jgi:hypothetical protein